jgi:hypothetical protein
MRRTKRAGKGFAVAAILTSLLTGTVFAEQEVEARAEHVCARIGQTSPSLQGSFNVDDLNIERDADGTVTLGRGGVKLGEIGRTSYADHLVCLVEVTALISSKT